MTAIHHFWIAASPFSLVVVSDMFPYYTADAVRGALSLTGGNLVEMPRPADGMVPTFAILAGALQTTLTGAQDLGALRSGLALTTAELISTLQARSVPAEGIGPTVSLTSSSLVTVLISTTSGPEALSPSLLLTSGSLA